MRSNRFVLGVLTGAALCVASAACQAPSRTEIQKRIESAKMSAWAWTQNMAMSEKTTIDCGYRGGFFSSGQVKCAAKTRIGRVFMLDCDALSCIFEGSQ